MIFSIKGLMIMALVLLMFGGAIYDLTTTGGRCALSMSNPETGYSCEEFWTTLGSTFLMPDRNIGKGTEGIMGLRQLDDETLNEIGVLEEVTEGQFRNQIIIGIIGEAALFILLAYIFIRASPSSGIDAGSMGVSIILAFTVMSLIMVMFDSQTPDPGFLEIPGGHTPFKGLRNLLANPQVLSDVVDDTSILPGTLNTGDITGGNVS